jgi:hypothetical protein
MSEAASSPTADAHAPPTPAEVHEALGVTVYDREGNTHTLGALTKDKRSVLIFTRHYCAQPPMQLLHHHSIDNK